MQDFSRKIWFVAMLALFFMSSCRKDGKIEPINNQGGDSIIAYRPDLPEQLYDYEAHEYPTYMTDHPLLQFGNGIDGPNQVTNEGATLGRVLFYDVQLSANNTIACASCHHQDKGFSDGEVFSKGFEGGLTGRNSMHIVNVELQRRFFWDERANTIEDQVLMPIQHPIEMGMELTNLVQKLSGIDYYAPLFEAAFGDPEITAERVSLALAQFLKAIRSYRSKYDKGVPINFSNFTAQELEGKAIWDSGEQSCINCHITENFGGVNRHITGLDSIYEDPGIGGLTGDPEDMGKFKTVSLRNIELTAPYMHDGRFATLEEVIDFYSEGIQPHPYLDDHFSTTFLTGGPPEVFNMSPEDKAALVAFLKTLTDWELVTDWGYSNPFPY